MFVLTVRGLQRSASQETAPSTGRCEPFHSPGPNWERDPPPTNHRLTSLIDRLPDRGYRPSSGRTRPSDPSRYAQLLGGGLGDSTALRFRRSVSQASRRGHPDSSAQLALTTSGRDVGLDDRGHCIAVESRHLGDLAQRCAGPTSDADGLIAGSSFCAEAGYRKGGANLAFLLGAVLVALRLSEVRSSHPTIPTARLRSACGGVRWGTDPSNEGSAPCRSV